MIANHANSSPWSPFQFLTVVAVISGTIAISTGPVHAQPGFINYQGELRKDGTPYDGIAFAKFAIVSDAGTTTLWSHDGTSTAGSEPTGSVSLDAVDGVFSIRLGESPMLPILAVSLSNTDDAALRMWVDAGTGFEQLSDQPIGSSAFALVCETTNQIGANTTSFIPRWTGSALESGTMFDNGKIGIGTMTPAAKLDVIGTIAVNGHIVVDATGKWVGEPGVGPPGPPGAVGPTPAHQWSGSNLRFQNSDGTWGLYANLLGPPPAHQWSGTSLRFMNPDGTWGPYVDLQGALGQPMTTYAVCKESCSGCSCAQLCNGHELWGMGNACTVTSDHGSCSAPVGGACCVCKTP